MITLGGMLGTMVIAAYEGRKVANFGVPGSYLQMDLLKDKFALLLLEGKKLNIMYEINP